MYRELHTHIPTSEAHSCRVPTTGINTSTLLVDRSFPSKGTAPVFSRACESGRGGGGGRERMRPMKGEQRDIGIHNKIGEMDADGIID